MRNTQKRGHAVMNEREDKIGKLALVMKDRHRKNTNFVFVYIIGVMV